jgi:hypothetical protein
MGSDPRYAVVRATEEMCHRAWGAREGLGRLGSKVTVEGRGSVLDLGKLRTHGARVELCAGPVAARVPAREISRHGVTRDRR